MVKVEDCNLRRMRGIHGPVFNFFPESYILPSEYMTLVRASEACRTARQACAPTAQAFEPPAPAGRTTPVPHAPPDSAALRRSPLA